MSGRRDYGRWESWMGYAILAVLAFVAVAFFAAGDLLLGSIGAAVSILWAVGRPR